MTRGKSLAIAAAIHLLSLLALSQNWFTISMVVDSTPVQLGSYSGASAYPVASPLSLLCLAALAVVAISSGVAQRLAIALTTISPSLALFLVLPPALESDVSALDSQLDRLTGIANTHGLQNLTVSQTPFIMVWALLVVLAAIAGVLMLLQARSWKTLDRGVKASRSAKRPAQTKTTIDLWDEQR